MQLKCSLACLHITCDRQRGRRLISYTLNFGNIHKPMQCSFCKVFLFKVNVSLLFIYYLANSYFYNAKNIKWSMTNGSFIILMFLYKGKNATTEILKWIDCYDVKFQVLAKWTGIFDLTQNIKVVTGSIHSRENLAKYLSNGVLSRSISWESTCFSVLQRWTSICGWKVLPRQILQSLWHRNRLPWLMSEISFLRWQLMADK